MPSPLAALSPLDGRYARLVDPLREYFSEQALIRYRVRIEIAWLRALAAEPAIRELKPFSRATETAFDRLLGGFSERDAEHIKNIEARTSHDVKAIEYWLKGRLARNREVQGSLEFIHFALTSEDVTNVAYALMLADSRARAMLPALDRVVAALRGLARRHAGLPMLSRTHGQPASPTTLGKEMANFAHRLERARRSIAAVAILGKMNGAVGNYNAHLAAYPGLDWERLCRRIVERLGLEFNPYTTQIEPHDSYAELFDAYARANSVLLDLDRDLWGYVSLGYFRQKAKKGEVGSSTMPHKVNPIDFENSEGNVGVANALLRHLAEKLPVSRWQRDLSDSTALRNAGAALGHALLAWSACAKGLAGLEADRARLAADLEANWEVLAEAVQQVMRRHGVADAYEKLKALTRGKRLDRGRLAAFIRKQPIPAAEKKRLLALSPARYTGLAAELAKRI
ncbi:MAG: adenylosuccinate lyase [Betaproteobacteria bacterium RIFCSPHIGHO2_12_FULL_69_13]|nr:MAG: adenylosuccinate lyase [Betaproteobacteria bacterium RIFCSPHIGHO2_12_FULL_69_13]OGA70333.1 MAG: adenylosuccinate lyase [Betaproteobacteria bacterium RIFCSPLOWO2_12_FULL_68_20]